VIGGLQTFGREKLMARDDSTQSPAMPSLATLKMDGDMASFSVLMRTGQGWLVSLSYNEFSVVLPIQLLTYASQFCLHAAYGTSSNNIYMPIIKICFLSDMIVTERE